MTKERIAEIRETYKTCPSWGGLYKNIFDLLDALEEMTDSRDHWKGRAEEAESDRYRWKARAEALERAIEGNCEYCTKRNQHCSCETSGCWQFDEARFAEEALTNV